MRSLLFVPGNQPAMLLNIDVFDCDAVIIDLEDAVSMNDKDSARELVRQYLLNYKTDKKIIIRVNAMDTGDFRLDMEMLSVFDIYALMLPKASRTTLDLFSKNYEFKLIPIVESAVGVVDIKDIVSHEEVIGVLLGAEDLASDMEMERTISNNEIFYPRQKLSYYCRAYQKMAIDTPCVTTNNHEVLYNDTVQAKSFGYKSKACIHPNQVKVVNEVFTPTKVEIEKALRIIETSKNHAGAYSLDGKMVDEPIIKRAHKLVEIAKSFGVEVEYE